MSSQEEGIVVNDSTIKLIGIIVAVVVQAFAVYFFFENKIEEINGRLTEFEKTMLLADQKIQKVDTLLDDLSNIKESQRELLTTETELFKKFVRLERSTDEMLKKLEALEKDEQLLKQQFEEQLRSKSKR